MAVSDEFLKYVTDQFSALGPVRTRRMFGGVGTIIGTVIGALIIANCPSGVSGHSSRGRSR